MHKELQKHLKKIFFHQNVTTENITQTYFLRGQFEQPRPHFKYVSVD